jgi:mRNA-degrading endonuclease RelE of RelBE toxin-antitoxin system
MYDIDWTPKATKQLKKIRDQRLGIEIYEAVEVLRHWPDCRNVKALAHHKHDYRLKVGKHRVLFDVHQTIQIIEIQEVKKRDERTY